MVRLPGSREISAGVDVVRNLCTLLFTVYRLAALLRVLLLTLLGAVHFPGWVLVPSARGRGQNCCGSGGFRSGVFRQVSTKARQERPLAYTMHRWVAPPHTTTHCACT